MCYIAHLLALRRVTKPDKLVQPKLSGTASLFSASLEDVHINARHTRTQAGGFSKVIGSLRLFQTMVKKTPKRLVEAEENGTSDGNGGDAGGNT